jgi:hypothetical protein
MFKHKVKPAIDPENHKPPAVGDVLRTVMRQARHFLAGREYSHQSRDSFA